AAQVARWQYGLYTRMPQHGLGGQANLRKQALGPTAGEVEHRLGICRSLWVADYGHVAWIFDIQQLARRLLRQAPRHFFIDEMNDLLADRRLAYRGPRRGGLPACGSGQY